MPYSGGKQRIAQAIADLLPPHESYIEPFAGALSVLLAKEPAPLEVVNDLNGDLVTFWRILRDQPDDLERVCALTPHARLEYRESWARPGDMSDLERARRVWVHLTQSRGSRLTRSGWRFVHGGNRRPLAAYLGGYVGRIADVAERIREVSIECRDAIEVIRAYGLPDAVLYVDPPYLTETRYGGQYEHEFGSPDQHERLLDALEATPAAVVLSGYASPLYDRRLSEWARHEFQSFNMRGAPRTEVVWIKPTNQPRVTVSDQPDLFGGAATILTR